MVLSGRRACSPSYQAYRWLPSVRCRSINRHMAAKLASQIPPSFCLCRQQQLLAKHCTRLLQLFGSLRDLRVARGQSLKRSRGNTNKNGPLHGAGPGCTDERSLLAENPQTKRGSNEQQSQHSEKRNEGAGLGQFRRRCSRRRGRCYCDQDRDIRRRGWRRGRHFS